MAAVKCHPVLYHSAVLIFIFLGITTHSDVLENRVIFKPVLVEVSVCVCVCVWGGGGGGSARHMQPCILYSCHLKSLNEIETPVFFFYIQ